MELSEKNLKTLLISVHRGIEESANKTANNIFNARLGKLIDYPPNGGLTDEEKEALKELKGNEDLKTALRKVIASSTANAFFDFFNLIDGTTDPEPGTGKWTEVLIVDKPKDFDEDQAFLHDEFYATYWDWKKKRKNKNWQLDLLDEE
ncbi:hypothetical protein Q0590_35180 [Rhodocytophaga aerolata]|uniref:Uncharacterized protein n=1 Tax=Rhodocytophaga aerolata TaxID=455078 RepID=A0ABT8RJH2_9BACT|nr:hypothetical protein [Rhodocytophaga aerolata]MDO1451569.1 hypothetical protein [Rhodocytophaga aerolata]